MCFVGAGVDGRFDVGVDVLSLCWFWWVVFGFPLLPISLYVAAGFGITVVAVFSAAARFLQFDACTHVWYRCTFRFLKVALRKCCFLCVFCFVFSSETICPHALMSSYLGLFLISRCSTCCFLSLLVDYYCMFWIIVICCLFLVSCFSPAFIFVDCWLFDFCYFCVLSWLFLLLILVVSCCFMLICGSCFLLFLCWFVVLYRFFSVAGAEADPRPGLPLESGGGQGWTLPLYGGRHAPVRGRSGGYRANARKGAQVRKAPRQGQPRIEYISRSTMSV